MGHRFSTQGSCGDDSKGEATAEIAVANHALLGTARQLAAPRRRTFGHKMKKLFQIIGPLITAVSFLGLALTKLYMKLNGLTEREFMETNGATVVWTFSGMFIAGLFLFLPISAHLREKEAGVVHPPPSKPFKIIAGIALLIFILIAIGVWAAFLLEK